MSDIRLIIFDLDGTLVPFPHEFFLNQAEKILPLLDHPPVAREELQAGFAAFDFFRFVVDRDKDRFTERFWEAFDWNTFPKPVPFAETLEVLHALRASGLTLGIATARMVTPEILAEELAGTGVLDVMTYVATREHATTHWTDKAPQIARVLEATGFRPDQAAMVGDIPPDITSARLCNLAITIAMQTGGLRRDVLEGVSPDFICEGLRELLDLLAR